MAKKKKGIQWHKLVNVQDVSDIAALMMSARKLLERRGQQAAQRLEHGVKDSHILDDIATLADRSGRLLARKKREFDVASQQTTEHLKQDAERLKQEAAHLKQEIQDSPLGHNIEGAAANLRDKVDQKTYETAKQIVEKHEQRHPEDDGAAGLFVVGAILGTAIGAALAFWYAPQSGEATRFEIERAAEEARRRVEGESVSDAIREGKAEARRYQETAGGK